MIKLENVTLLTTKGDSEPINFVAENKVNYLDANEKNLFKVLSIKQQYIKDGTMSIDDFSLFPLKDQRKYAFVLAINSAVINLNAVFVFELSFKDKSRTILKHDLASLREMSLEDPENKIKKIDAIFEMLAKHEVAYVLIDGSDPINKANRLLINETLDRLENMCVLFLRPQVKMNEVVIGEDLDIDAPNDKEIIKDEVEKVLKEDKASLATPIVAPNKVKETPLEEDVREPDEVSKEDIEDLKALDGVDTDEQLKSSNKDIEEEDLLAVGEENKIKANKSDTATHDYEKEFENFDLPAAYDFSDKEYIKDIEVRGEAKVLTKMKCSHFSMYFRTMFKHLYLYYLFNALFSVFLGVCSFSSIYLIKTSNSLIAGILIFLDIVFVFMHLYILGSTYAGLKNKLVKTIEKAGFVFLFILFTLVGLALGYGFIAILSANDVFVDLTQYVTADYALGIVVGIIALVSPFFVKYLSIGYMKLSAFVRKYLPKKANE